MSKIVKIGDSEYNLDQIANALKNNTKNLEKEKDQQEFVKLLMIFLLFRYSIICRLLSNQRGIVQGLYIFFTMSLATLISQV